MDFHVSEATREEVGSEGGHLISIDCYECGCGMWTEVRDGVPTEVKCFRSHCAAITIVTVVRNAAPDKADEAESNTKA